MSVVERLYRVAVESKSVSNRLYISVLGGFAVYLGLTSHMGVFGYLFASVGAVFVLVGYFSYRSARERFFREALELLRGRRFKVRYVPPAKPGVTYYSVEEVSREMGISEEAAASAFLTMLRIGWVKIEGEETVNIQIDGELGESEDGKA